MYKSSAGAPLSDRLRWALRWVSNFLTSSVPRRISLNCAPSVLRLYTDGACEPLGDSSVVTMGGVLDSDSFARPKAFGWTAPDIVWRRWDHSGSGQVIGQAEIAPVVLALTLWPDFFRHQKVLVFIDNDAARQGLVKGYSPMLASGVLIAEV
jgi:hypothetical protein